MTCYAVADFMYMCLLHISYVQVLSINGPIGLYCYTSAPLCYSVYNMRTVYTLVIQSYAVMHVRGIVASVHMYCRFVYNFTAGNVYI